MKLTKLKAIIGPLLAACFVASTAGASTFYQQAGAGHPFLGSGDHDWDTTWEDWRIAIKDGRTVYTSTPSVGTTVTRTWVLHYPINATNRNWEAKGYGSGGIKTRICSFTSSGSFSSCGSSVAAGSDSVAHVPSAGTVFTQSYLKSQCIAGGNCGVQNKLYHVRVRD